MLHTLIIKILFKKAWLGNACSPALPVPKQLPYPGYATAADQYQLSSQVLEAQRPQIHMVVLCTAHAHLVPAHVQLKCDGYTYIYRHAKRDVTTLKD